MAMPTLQSKSRWHSTEWLITLIGVREEMMKSSLKSNSYDLLMRLCAFSNSRLIVVVPFVLMVLIGPLSAQPYLSKPIRV